MNGTCDTVLNANMILPNVANAINGNSFNGLKMIQGTLDDIVGLSDNIREGVILIFSKNGLVDIIYKRCVGNFLNKYKDVAINNTNLIILHSIEGVSNQEIALKMVFNYLNLILDNCDE